MHLTAAGAAVANYPFCTIDPNVGVVEVPDERLDKLAEMVHPKRIVPATMEFLDIAGLVRGASKGEGLGNQFLGHIRGVNAVGHGGALLLRHQRDARRGQRRSAPGHRHDHHRAMPGRPGRAWRSGPTARARAAKSGDSKLLAEAEALDALAAHLNDGRPARTFRYAEELAAGRRGAASADRQAGAVHRQPGRGGYGGDLTQRKPEALKVVEEFAAAEGAQAVAVSAKIEAELAELGPEDAAFYMEELGMPEGGLPRMIRAGYALLDLITFLTAGEPEVRAWTIRRGTRAPQAAGTIHSDIERGFIRAEVTAYQDLVAAGSFARGARARRDAPGRQGVRDAGW